MLDTRRLTACFLRILIPPYSLSLHVLIPQYLLRVYCVLSMSASWADSRPRRQVSVCSQEWTCLDAFPFKLPWHLFPWPTPPQSPHLLGLSLATGKQDMLLASK